MLVCLCASFVLLQVSQFEQSLQCYHGHSSTTLPPFGSCCVVSCRVVSCRVVSWCSVCGGVPYRTDTARPVRHFTEDVVLSAAASEVFVFDVSTGSKLAAHRATGFVRDARWRGDGARVALADAGRCAVLSCDAQTRALRPVAAFPPECGAGEDPGTRACAFSPDGSRVAAVGYESGLWVYGEGTAARGLGRGGHAAGLTCVDWGRGADGDGVLATASDDGVVCVWQGSPEACARTLCVHEGVPWKVAGGGGWSAQAITRARVPL